MTTTGRAVKGIDHALVIVPNLASAFERYRQLGFEVQPEGRHTKLGTANHVMIFERDYLELIGVVEPTPYNEDRRAWLKLGGGLANAALATDGADIARAAFAKADLNPDPVLDFGRAVEIDGKQEEARFRIVRVPKNKRPILGLFVCEQITPQFVYRKEWAQHPNGVRGLAGISVVANDPLRVTALCVRFFGETAVKPDGDGLRVETGTQPVRYMTRGDFTSRYPGIAPIRTDDHAALVSLRTPDPDAVGKLLTGNGVPHKRAPDGRVLVAASDACSVALEFVRD
jgi:hypothetical protein